MKKVRSRIREKINLLLCNLIEKEEAFKEKIFSNLKLKEYLIVNILQEDQKTYSIDFMNLLRKFFDYPPFVDEFQKVIIKIIEELPNT